MAEHRSRYQELQKIGEGTYGVVYMAKDKTTGSLLALKKIRLDDDQDNQGVPSTAIREVSVLMELKHPNIVELVSVRSGAQRLTLAFEYMDFDLKKYMDRKPGKLSDSEIMTLTHQFLVGLDFCHRKRIIHRDLKPQNLLIDSHLTLKIADFGLARAFQWPMPAYTHEIVTLWYRSPTVLLGSKKYTTQLDIWSVGTIFAEMVNKRPLFPGDSEIDQLFKIFQLKGTPNRTTWPDVRDCPDWQAKFPQWKPKPWNKICPTLSVVGQSMLSKMLEYDPNERASAQILLEHPYFYPLLRKRTTSPK